MSDWKQMLARVAGNADDIFDALRYRLKKRFGYDDPFQILPYRTYGSADLLYLKGRVLEDKGVTASGDNDTAWQNLLNMYRRLESDEVPHARLRARFGRLEREISTDGEGYFETNLTFTGETLDASRLWHEVELELLEPLAADQKPVRATAEVLVPPSSARFGVISDIDDTVIWTSTGDKLRMARMVFLQSIRTRLPFKGVAAFYQALQRGAGGGEGNPIFYVSSSPWNLYDLLDEFFEMHKIPRGPLMLRDIGVTSEALYAESHDAHKLNKIKPVLERYPSLPFILIGDTSQRDPEIYREVVRAYPERILAVYIRNVTPDPARQDAVGKLIEEVREAGSQLVLAHDSLFAATHAAEQGWIAADALAEVREEKKEDERAPSAQGEDAGSPGGPSEASV